MNSRFLIAASILTISLGSAPVYATSVSADVNAKSETTTPSVKEDIKREWENTKEAVSNAADKTAQATKDAYENIKATFISDTEGTASADVSVNSQTTATGILGQPVLNSKGEKIATVEDIILNADGTASTVVLADGGFAGIGTKLAAFDYSVVSQRNEDGDVLTSLSEETLAQVTPFSYNADDAKNNAKVRIQASDAISLKKLLDGQILNAEKKIIADIDNISLKGGKANYVIIAFDQTLGLGGKKAAMDFKNGTIVRKGEDLDIQLSAAQSANFENFKKGGDQ